MQKNSKLIISILYVAILIIIYCISDLQNFCILYALTTTIFTSARTFYSKVRIVDSILECIIFQLPVVLIVTLQGEKTIGNEIRLIVFSIIVVNMVITLILQICKKDK